LVYDWDSKKKILEPLVKSGAQVIYIPNKGRKKESIFQRLRFEWLTRFEQRFFINKFEFSSYDFVVVNQGGFMEVTNHPWKNIYKKLKKYCLTFHNYTLDYQFKDAKANCLKQWMSNAFVNVGDAARGKILEQQLSFKLKNFKALVNPLTIKRSETYSAYPSLINGNYKFIMLAQLDVSRKAQDNLIKVIAQPQWKDRNIVLELYGGGEHYEMLNNLIQQLKVEDKVFLMGNTNNVAEVLDTAHLALQITHRDAMPISVVEAASRSKALVVSDIGDMPLWIENNGWIAPDASIESISAVLEKAWEQRNDWEEMGRNSFNLFQRKFPKSVETEFYKLISDTNV
jgi:glycosyltransferase involved in cell wall biosynthesis